MHTGKEPLTKGATIVFKLLWTKRDSNECHGFALTPPYRPMPLQRRQERNRAAPRSVVRRERRGSRSEVPLGRGRC